MGHMRRFPILTVATLGASALVTATRLFSDGPLDALRRDPAALEHGQLWRLISPVLVQSDSSLFSVIAVFALCAAIGVYAERFLSPLRWLTLYLCGAVAGHGIGDAFQPLRAEPRSPSSASSAASPPTRCSNESPS